MFVGVHSWLLGHKTRLSAAPNLLLCRHADLRISLRKVRTRQRDSGALQQLGRDEMPALRLDQTGKEILHVRLCNCRQHQHSSNPQLHRHAAFLRHVWHGPTALSLTWSNLSDHKLASRSRVSSLPPPNRAGDVGVHPASLRQWLRPVPLRRSPARSGCPVVCRR